MSQTWVFMLPVHPPSVCVYFSYPLEPSLRVNVAFESNFCMKLLLFFYNLNSNFSFIVIVIVQPVSLPDFMEFRSQLLETVLSSKEGFCMEERCVLFWGFICFVFF